MTGRPSPVQGSFRVVRGVVLAVTSTVLSVAAHVVGGGMAPDIGVTALLTAGVAAVGIATAGQRRSLGMILLTLGVAQIGMHVLLSMFGDMEHDGASAAPMTVDPLVMTIAHAMAAALMAVLLTGADSVIFRVAAVLTRLLPSPLIGLPAAGAHLVLPRADALDRALVLLLWLASPRRGPPVAVRPVGSVARP